MSEETFSSRPAELAHPDDHQGPSAGRRGTVHRFETWGMKSERSVERDLREIAHRGDNFVERRAPGEVARSGPQQNARTQFA